MSDANQPHNAVGPILSINIGPKLMPVAKVLNDLNNLDRQKLSLETQIASATLEGNTDIAEKLGRQLATVESAIEVRDSSIKIRHGHMHRRPAINSD